MLLIRIFIFIMIFSSNAFANDCKISKMLGHPDLANNEKFWLEYSELTKHDDAAVEALIKKHASHILQTQQATASLSQGSFTISRTAQKEHVRLSEVNKKHFDEFTKVVNEEGINGLYARPGKWHLEKMHEKDYKDHFTIRLDLGYRVAFKIKDNNVEIVRIGNDIGH